MPIQNPSTCSSINLLIFLTFHNQIRQLSGLSGIPGSSPSLVSPSATTWILPSYIFQYIKNMLKHANAMLICNNMHCSPQSPSPSAVRATIISSIAIFVQDNIVISNKCRPVPHFCSYLKQINKYFLVWFILFYLTLPVGWKDDVWVEYCFYRFNTVIYRHRKQQQTAKYCDPLISAI